MHRKLAVGLTFVGLCLSLAAEARQVDLSDAPVIRQRSSWLKGRFEVAPAVGVTLDDLYVRTLLIGISADYFPTTWLGVGVDFRYGLGFDTGLAKDVKSYTQDWNRRERSQVDSGEKEASDMHQQNASFANLNLLAGAHLTFVPLFGKMMLFDAAQMAFDLHFLAGGGFVMVKGSGDLKDQNTFYPMLGVGLRLFFVDFFGLTVQVRDYLVKMADTAPLGYYKVSMDQEQGRLTSIFVREGSRKEWRSNWEITFGLAFYFPTDVKHEK